MLGLVRLSRIVLPLVGLLGVVAVLGEPGCSAEATQGTLDIRLESTRAQCSETNGTAITVGVTPEDTELRAGLEFVTASTDVCDPGTGRIGTLAVVPSDPNRASVIVVVAAKKTGRSTCKPPFYKGCIVARRQFRFAKNRNLYLPITIDPLCEDVPCDAFSTCRTGKCFSAETSCDDNDSCPEPGDPGDGGTSEDGQVTPDVGPLPDGATDAMPDGMISSDGGDAGDAATDAPNDGNDGAAAGGARCDGTNILYCANPMGAEMACGLSASFCCDTSPITKGQCNPVAACTSGRYCCATTDCTGSDVCPAAGAGGPTVPRFCQAAGTRCDTANGGKLVCGGQTCNVGASCCGATRETATCQARPCASEYCCMGSDCNSGVCPAIIIIEGPALPGLVPGSKGQIPQTCN